MDWRDVVGFPDYEVSEDGDVRNKVSGHLLKPYVKPDGRHMYRLRKNMEYFTMYSHNMVAEAFLDELNVIRRTNRVVHVDGDHSNNNWMNLGYIRGPGRRRSR